MATTNQGSYNKNDNIYIQQTCYEFMPPLEKGANLVVMVFYTHHDSFDDVLMYSVPIPGYINSVLPARPLTGSEKHEILSKLASGELQAKQISSE
jgi:hypothetical protein